MRTFIALFAAGLVIAASHESYALDDEATPSADRVVGTVLGKPVTANAIKLTSPIDPNVKFDARDRDRWQLMTRISQAFGQPIAARFVREQKIEATPEELTKFEKSMERVNKKQLAHDEKQLAEVRARLLLPNLTTDEREKSLQKQKRLEQSIEASKSGEATREIGKQVIVAWKTERELHRKYGGRVIFQQFGAEALDARRLLFEEAEKNGDLTFTDPGVRHLFYYYSHMRHTTIDADALEKPWFFGQTDSD